MHVHANEIEKTGSVYDPIGKFLKSTKLNEMTGIINYPISQPNNKLINIKFLAIFYTLRTLNFNYSKFVRKNRKHDCVIVEAGRVDQNKFIYRHDYYSQQNKRFLSLE